MKCVWMSTIPGSPSDVQISRTSVGSPSAFRVTFTTLPTGSCPTNSPDHLDQRAGRHQTDIVADNASRVLDAHIHQWDPFTTPRVVSGPAKVIRRVPLLGPILMRAFPRAAREFAGDPQYLFNTYLPGDYQADAAPVQVEAVVHIEAGWQAKRPIDSVDETRWVSSLTFGQDGAPELAAIVVHADPSDPGVAEVLDAHLAASTLVRGVRYVAAHSPDRGIVDFVKRPNELSEPAFLRGFAAVAERGLSFERSGSTRTTCRVPSSWPASTPTRRSFSIT